MKRKNVRKTKSLLRRMAVRRLKNSKETVLLACGMLFSVLLISFFLFFTVTVKGAEMALVQGLPHGTFVRKVADGMHVAAILLSAATLLTMRTWAGLSAEAFAGTTAVLQSIGATASQQRYWLFTLLGIQYFPALLAGVSLGSVCGIGMSRALLGGDVSIAQRVPVYLLLWAAILLVSGGLLVLCYMLPRVQIRKLTPSTAERLRRRGRSVSAEAHGYRNSKTYKQKSLLKRLASKSVDFYKARYGSLAISLAVSVFYPLLAGLLMYHLLGASVVLDTNQFDGVDTASVVMDSVRSLLAVIALGFLLLTVQGLWSGGLLIRTQLEQRKKTGRAYLSMGMTEGDFRRVMLLELKSLLLKGSLYLLFMFLTANFSFSYFL